MSDTITDLTKQFQETQAKHVEFLMALAASCVAYAVHRSVSMAPSKPMLLLAASVVFWSLSVICGLRNRAYVLSSMYANIALLKIGRGLELEVGNDPSRIDTASRGVMSAIETNSARASWYWTWQYRLLLFGGLCFVSWHALEIVNTPKHQAETPILSK